MPAEYPISKGVRRIMETTDGNIAKAIIRRNNEEVQGRGNFVVFDELFADDFIDRTPQVGWGSDKEAVRGLYTAIRVAFPDFWPEIHRQWVDGDVVITHKTYHGTHQGEFLGIPATGRKVSFDCVDAMRVSGSKIVEHWGAANLLSVLAQLDALPH
jgi:predicted ester cyclase